MGIFVSKKKQDSPPPSPSAPEEPAAPPTPTPPPPAKVKPCRRSDQGDVLFQRESMICAYSHETKI